MKITKISINNLASIAGEHRIDFTQEPLKSAGIFAIAGPTGSGKSTILDALCLALYDRIPRFQQASGKARIGDGDTADISQNDVRNILRRGTGSGFAEVEFEDDNQIRYASRWSVHRSHNSPTGNLQSQRIRVMNVTTDTELQGTKTELLAQLERLIGLSYEQFTRTVLLAQNDFATFLKSDENAKAELLEKLTGTAIYSKISMKLFELTKAKNAEVEGLMTQIETLETLSDEEIEQLKSEVKQEEDLLHKTREKQLLTNKLKETFDEIKRQQRELQAKERELLEKKSLLEKHQQKVVKISGEQEAFERQKKQEAPQISKATQLDALIADSHKVLADLTKKVSLAERQKNEKQKELKAKEQAQTVIRQKAKEIYSSLKLNRSFDDMPAVYAHLDERKEAIQNQHHALTKQKEELQLDKVYQLQADLDTQKSQLNQLDSAFKLYTEKAKELESVRKQLQEERSKQQQLLAKQLGLKESLPQLEQKLQHLKSLYEKVQQKMHKSVEAIRASLQANEPCPVCGSTEHQLNTEEVRAEHSVLKEELEVAEQSWTKESTNLKVVESELKQLVESIEQNTLKEKELNEACLTYKANYTEEVFQAKYIQEQQLKLQKLSKKYAAILQQAHQMQAEMDKLIQEKNRIQGQQDQLHQAHDAYLQVSNECKGLQKEWSSLEQAYQERIKEHQDKQAQLQQLQLERQALLGGKSVAAFQLELESKESQLKQQFEAAEQDKQLLSTEQAKLSGQTEQLKLTLAELQLKVAGTTQDENEAQLALLKQQAEEIEKKLNTTRSKLSTDKTQRERKAKLEKDYDKLHKAAENWNKLNAAFGQANGAKFQVIAQSYTLRVLLMHANQHLKYLAPRYRLEQIGTALALKIIDQDMGDAERTVYSLSGGESFLVSLALALGLSSISSGNLRVDSLFIDEGFGSLDADSLRTAMDALEQLQRLGRKVGVISHVQEMSERIAVQIRLEKGMSGKSTLTIA